MQRKLIAPLCLLFAFPLFGASATPADAQIVTRTGSTRRLDSSGWRSLRETAPREPIRIAREDPNSPYEFLRESLKLLPTKPSVRQVDYEAPVDLPPPPSSRRLYRGQEPADTRPRLNGIPRSEIIRDETVPADTRPRLNSPPDVFRDRRFESAPSCQSPTPTYYRGYPSTYRRPTTRYYNSPTNPGGLPESRYQIGRGVIGQPTLYVRDQPLRNFIRWLTY